MSDMTMNGGDAGEARGSATLAMFLWVVVVCALAYGLYNTLIKVIDLFAGRSAPRPGKPAAAPREARRRAPHAWSRGPDCRVG